METHNIISTPAITGNIGSCSSQTTHMIVSGNFWEYQTKDYLTNSCTGQVLEGGEHWNAGFGWWTVPGFVVLVLIVMLGYILDNY